MPNKWEKYPSLGHLSGKARERMEVRRRHRKVRYLLYRLKNSVEKNEPLKDPDHLPGFVDFWLGETAEYQIDPKGRKIEVPANLKNVPVCEIGGYAEFAKRWDVDEDLMVYLRHASVWQEWNAKLAQVVPILGEI